MRTKSTSVTTSDLYTYNWKYHVTRHINRVLFASGWRGWPNEKDCDENSTFDERKARQNTCISPLHEMLIRIKESIRQLDYPYARKKAEEIIETYRQKVKESEIKEIDQLLQHIGSSKYIDSVDETTRLMLFAEFNGSKREHYAREFDRILVTKSFRHLQYKTQIMVNSASDDQRTRLLHSMEVQRIARTLAIQLRANTSLVQTIAIGHDVGHAPFGHAGERAISDCLTTGFYGDFSHALQSVKVLNDLERHPIMERYGFRGLGISVEVLSGILKHDTDSFSKDITSAAFRLQYDSELITHYPYTKEEIDDKKREEIEKKKKDLKKKNKKDGAQTQAPDIDEIKIPLTMGTLEAQIVYWADKIAYIGHDWEEFVLSSHIDELLPDINNIVGKIGEILAIKYKEIPKEVVYLDEIHQAIKDMNKLYAPFERTNGQNPNSYPDPDTLRTNLNINIQSLLNVKKDIIKHSDEVTCTLLSRIEYNMLFDYFEVAQAWMQITERAPKKYKECNDIIYILYRYFKDTISQRSTPSIEGALIKESYNRIQKMNSVRCIVEKSTDDWEKNKLVLKDIQNDPLMKGWEIKKKAKELFMKSLVVKLNDDTITSIQNIDSFKFRNYINSKEVQQMTDKASRIIHELFRYYLAHPEMLPDQCMEEYFLLVDGRLSFNRYQTLVKEYIADEFKKIMKECKVEFTQDGELKGVTSNSNSDDNSNDKPDDNSKPALTWDELVALFEEQDPQKNKTIKTLIENFEKSKQTKNEKAFKDRIKKLPGIVATTAKTKNELMAEEFPISKGRQTDLFNSTLAQENKRLYPFSNHVSETILARIIADYICSMTDRMAILKYNEITSSKTSWTENYNA